jgi:ADP-ribosylglycohydrolase
MLGAIAGDIIGSAYEWRRTKSYDFDLFTPRSRFTDDTVLTIAVADCILHNKEYATTFKEYGRSFPRAGWGGMFSRWIRSDNIAPYNSFGNGSAMRVSPIGFAFNTLDRVLDEAKHTAEVTHNHSEGIKGAQAVAVAIFFARNGHDKAVIKEYIEKRFDYNLHRSWEDIRPSYRANETCQGSVPEAIIAFLDSTSFEDAVRKAVSLGGDADTQACIAGGIAQAYYKDIPNTIVQRVRSVLLPDFIQILDDFENRFGCQC